MVLKTIQDVCSELHCHAHTVRSYEKMGYLQYHKDTSGRRLFAPEHVEQIRAIYNENLRKRPWLAA